jgi:hypothetical protein
VNNFISYKDWLNEEFVGHGRAYDSTFEIVKNPKPSEIPNNIRAIGDSNGDVWVAISNEDWATHVDIVTLVNRLNLRDSIIQPYTHGEDFPETIALHRCRDTNIFALGESYRIGGKVNEKTWKKLIKKQTSWKFIDKKITQVMIEEL